MPPRGLHYGLLLSTLLLLGSCVPPSRPFYAGPILGDSVRIYPLPYPVNTPMNEVFPTISRDWKWFYFGRRRNDTTWLYRTAIDSGHAPVISSAVERFLPNTATRVYFAAIAAVNTEVWESIWRNGGVGRLPVVPRRGRNLGAAGP